MLRGARILSSRGFPQLWNGRALSTGKPVISRETVGANEDLLTSSAAPGFSWRFPGGKVINRQNHVLALFDLIFLGSGGSFPSRFKSSSCSMLSLGSQRNFLFDAGEGALRQSIRSDLVSMTDVSNIFITHMHADHILGLPSVILMACLRASEVDIVPLQIYGPKGLYQYLTTVVSATQSTLRRKVIVHELMFGEEEMWRVRNKMKIPWFPNYLMWKPKVKDFYVNHKKGEWHHCPSIRNMERREIWPDADGTFSVMEESYIEVKARLLPHKVPCFGFVAQEKDVTGALQVEKVREMGIPVGKHLSFIKEGMDTIMPDGTVIPASDLLGPPMRGRKLAYLGDTNDSANLVELSRDADVVVHEASYNDDSYQQAFKLGHATPRLATKFATDANARRLIMNHLGSQYVQGIRYPKGPVGNSNSDIKMDTDIQLEARKYFNPKRCIIARDFVSVSIPPGGYEDSPEDNRFQLSFHGIGTNGKSGRIEELESADARFNGSSQGSLYTRLPTPNQMKNQRRLLYNSKSYNRSNARRHQRDFDGKPKTRSGVEIEGAKHPDADFSIDRADGNQNSEVRNVLKKNFPSRG